MRTSPNIDRNLDYYNKHISSFNFRCFCLDNCKKVRWDQNRLPYYVRLFRDGFNEFIFIWSCHSLHEFKEEEIQTAKIHSFSRSREVVTRVVAQEGSPYQQSWREFRSNFQKPWRYKLMATISAALYWATLININVKNNSHKIDGLPLHCYIQKRCLIMLIISLNRILVKFGFVL